MAANNESQSSLLSQLLEEDRRNIQKIEAAKYEPRPKPMPMIQSNPNVQGPLYVTQDYIDKKTRKRLKRRAENQHDARIEMIKLISQREHLVHKLNQLDFRKKHDAKKIASINNRLNDIDAELDMLETQSGVHVEDIKQGTRGGRILYNVKMFAKKTFKKVKKFFKRNSDIIFGILSVAIPSLISIITSRVQASKS